MQNKFVRVGDVALYFDVTPETIRSWIKKRGLPARKISGQWRFDWNEIKNWDDNKIKAQVSPRRYKDYATADTALNNNRNFRKEINAGQVRLINGDCLISMACVDDSSVDLLLTDPPYNLGLFMQERSTNLKRMRSNYFGAAGWDNLSSDDWVVSMEAFLS